MESFTNEVLGPGTARRGEAIQPAPAHEEERAEDKGEIEAIGDKVRDMQNMLRSHIEMVQAQAYTDSLTGVGNMAVYAEKTEQLSEAIKAGGASFALGIFDVNGLKQINDRYGHEQGDHAIVGSAEALIEAFGLEHVFRVGGDEFVVVMEHVTPEEITFRLQAFDDALAAINERRDKEFPDITVSRGWSAFHPQEDQDTKSVVRRADEDMYRAKAAFYNTHPDRRGR